MSTMNAPRDAATPQRKSKKVRGRGHVDVFVAGIPARAVVLSYFAGRPARTYGPPENCSPEEYPEIEYEICDQRGYAAPWLERKLTDRLRDDLDREVMARWRDLCRHYDD